jgi:beta-glucosidase
MNLDEKIAFCSGATFWKTKQFSQYGIPSITLSDGPHGIRKQEGEADHLGLNASVKTTCFPTASLLGSTWDVDLIEEIGEALGKEAVQEDVNVILGPGVNMKRSPLSGRNFEYYSEDPFLSGKLAASWIKGVQNTGTGVSLKHFAGNSQESKRMSSDSLIDERALHEYYLPAFEIAVKESQPTTVMCSYNKVNGTYASDHEELLTKILRDEWGFEGAVITDWGAMHDRVEGFKAGLDLEMPGSKGAFDDIVKEAVKSGRLSEADIDRSVVRLLQLIERTTNRVEKQEDAKKLFQQHHQLARRAAQSGGILLKNEDNILPLCPSEKLVVIGQLADKPRYQGTGSSLVSPTELTSILDGLKEYKTDFSYYQGYELNDVDNEDLLKEALSGVEKGLTVLVAVGLTEIYESEGFDRTTLSIPTNQLKLLHRLREKTNNVIAVLVGGSAVETSWLKNIKACLHMQLSGQAGGLATADLLYGTVNPSGRLSETYPEKLNDVVNSSYYCKNPKQVPYRESMYVGYRYFDKVQKSVAFPFGFGLSYTTFAYDNVQIVQQDDTNVIVQVDVMNTGQVDGAEVVQLYVEAPLCGVYRPQKELKGFKKIMLAAGEERTVSFQLDKRSFAFYDGSTQDWQVEEGQYTIQIGSSSNDIRITCPVQLAGIRPVKSNSSNWYYNLEGEPTIDDFISIYGDFKPFVMPEKGQFSVECSVFEMKDQSFIFKQFYKAIEKVIAKSTTEDGKPDYNNVHFKMLMASASDNPIRTMALLSPGFLTFKRIQLLVDFANGKPFKGIANYLKNK